MWPAVPAAAAAGTHSEPAAAEPVPMRSAWCAADYVDFLTSVTPENQEEFMMQVAWGLGVGCRPCWQWRRMQASAARRHKQLTAACPPGTAPQTRRFNLGPVGEADCPVFDGMMEYFQVGRGRERANERESARVCGVRSVHGAACWLECVRAVPTQPFHSACPQPALPARPRSPLPRRSTAAAAWAAPR